MAETKAGVPEFDEINSEELLRRKEDEYFDRIRGGQENIGKAIAAFGTKHGGLLLVGQDDLKQGGHIFGVDEGEFYREYSNAVQNVSPKPLVQQRTLEHKGMKLALIRIQDVGDLRPCSYLGVYYERKGDTNARLSPDEVKRYHLLYGSANTEDMPTHAKKADLDETELGEYVKFIGKSKENVVQSVLSEKGFLTVRGVVVLSKKPEDFLEGAFVEVQRYDTVMGSSPAPVGPPVKISKPARLMIEETVRIIEQNLPVVRTYEGAGMIQSPAIPVSIIREAVTNAAAHRNYHSHEHIRVRIYADGFGISNPAAITPQMWAEIVATQTTYHPNEGIYTFLNPAHLYEGRGEGIWKIKEELAKLGKAAPEFKVIGEAPSVFYARIVLSPGKAKNVKRQKLEELISKKSELTTSEVMHYLKISRVTAIHMLNDLVSQGRLEHTGSTRSSKYLVKRINPG